MPNRGMTGYTGGVGPTYGARRADGTTGGPLSAGNRHLGTRHPPVRSIWPKTAGTTVGSGTPGGSLWGLIAGRPSSGQLWPRR
jgi:hypothetical protein